MNLKDMSLSELKKLATKRQIQGRSKMNKSALMAALTRSVKPQPINVQPEFTKAIEVEAARVITNFAKERSNSANRYFESLESKVTRAAGFSGLLLTVLASVGGATAQAPKDCLGWIMFRKCPLSR